MAITNIHHRSRSAVLATSATAPPAWVRSVGVAGRHSGEYVSTATTPRSGPPGVVYAYTPGGNSSSARPVASKRNVSVRVVPPAVNVTARSRGDPEPVQRHASGMPFDTSYVSGATRSLLPAPSASSQSVNAATSARYASALAPPRNAQRNSPAAATVAWRALPPFSVRSERTSTGRGAPRRAWRAVSTTTAVLSRGSARSDTAAAGASESHAIPPSAPASGDGPGSWTYQSPSWPCTVRHVRTAPGPENRSNLAGSPTRTTRRAPATARATSALETGARLAASRQRRSPPAGSDSTNARTGTPATSLIVRARKRLSQPGGEPSGTTEGGGLPSSTNTRAAS